ncbi:MAG: phosphoribosylformylglycinamidine cyclo-ligase [Nitrospirae bacterium]|nr:phosphoribosylformylglycinamidine cyclo-ligase [Nitrospirota bacterium]MBI3351520.1 phosphoribosylformylglycinamidine cyclo-ligase [Nitrospirota bacterium]
MPILEKLSYKKAGVDISLGNRFVKKITPLVRKTFRSEVYSDLGGFSGLFQLKKYKNPLLVSGTDGVGTKLKIAFLMNQHDTVGIDLVAMCVNDIVVTGAEPLFFLDYMASGKLDLKRSVAILKGIVGGCRQAGCALIGGETAEMPSFYPKGEYDLAGFAVGVVEKKKLIDGHAIKPGDAIIGLASSGLHSNGFSLVRKIVFEKAKLKPGQKISELGEKLGTALLRPTRIYVKTVLKLKNRFNLKGMAHITGGGITENLPRILPKNCQAEVFKKSWKIPPLFSFLQQAGGISENEMFRDFNMGIGFILIVPKKEAKQVILSAKKLGEKAFLVGEVRKGKNIVHYD